MMQKRKKLAVLSFLSGIVIFCLALSYGYFAGFITFERNEIVKLTFNQSWDRFFVWEAWNPEGTSEHSIGVEQIHDAFAGFDFPLGASGTLMLDENGSFWAFRFSEWIYLQTPDGPLPSTGLTIDIGPFALANGFSSSEPLKTTDVHGTAVTAYLVDYGAEQVEFWSTFDLGGFPYALSFSLDRDDINEGKEHMSEAVSLLIINPPNLGVLTN